MLTRFIMSRNWPQVGELDIMENVNAVNKLYGTLHCGVNPGGPCDETNGLSGNTVPSPAMQGNYLQYTVEVDRTDASAEAINWYLGDKLYHTVKASQVSNATTWAEAVHGSFFVLLNLAIGGSFPDKVYGSKTPVASTASSGTMFVEYVAVYNSA
jgi:beta-glucanase (GH16 family)